MADDEDYYVPVDSDYDEPAPAPTPPQQQEETWSDYQPPQQPEPLQDQAPGQTAQAKPQETWEDYKPPAAEETWEDFKPPAEPDTQLGAFSREVAHGAGPAAAAAATGILAGAATQAAIPIPGSGIVGGLIGGFGGGYLGEVATDKTAKALGIDDDAIRAANAKEHPWTVAAGQGVSNIVGFGRGAVDKGVRAASAAISGAGEVGSQIYQRGWDFFTPKGFKEAVPSITAQTAAGWAFAKPYGWGDKLEALGTKGGASIGERLGTRAPEMAPVPPPPPASITHAEGPAQGQLPFGGDNLPFTVRPPEGDGVQRQSLQPGIGGGERQPELPFEQPFRTTPERQAGLPLEPPPTVNSDGQLGFNIRSGMPDTAGTAKELAAPPRGEEPHSSLRYSKEATARGESGSESGINVLQPGQADPAISHSLRANDPHTEQRMADQGVAPRQPGEPLRTGDVGAAEQRAMPEGQRPDTGTQLNREFPRAEPPPQQPQQPQRPFETPEARLAAMPRPEGAPEGPRNFPLGPQKGPVTEHYPLHEKMLDNPKQVGVFERLKAGPGGDVVRAAEAKFNDLVKQINDAGFKVGDVNAASAKGHPEITAAKQQLMEIGGALSRMVVGQSPRIPKNGRLAGDLEQIKGLLAVKGVRDTITPPPKSTSAPENNQFRVGRNPDSTWGVKNPDGKMVSTHPNMGEAIKAARAAGAPPKQAMVRRDMVERGRDGRPLRTEPLPIGTERSILERGAEKATGPKLPPEQAPPERQAMARAAPPETKVKTHDGAVFSGATIHEAAARAKAGGYRPHQIFQMDGKAYTPPKAAPPPKAVAAAATSKAAASSAPPTPPPPKAPAGPVRPGTSEVKTGGSIKEHHSEAVKAVLGRVADSPTFMDKIPKSIPEAKEWLHDRYTDIYNAFHPADRLKAKIEELTGKSIPTERDFAQLARATKGLGGRTQAIYEHGPYDVKTGNVIGPALKPILEKMSKDPAEFVAYALAKHAIETEAHGLKTGIPLKEANQVVAELGSKWGPVAKELGEYQSAMLRMSKDLIGAENIAKMEAKYQFYVPLYRALDPKSEMGDFVRGGGLSVKDPVLGREGSTRPIVNPLESIMRNTVVFADLAEKNRVHLAMREVNDSLPKEHQFLTPSKAGAESLVGVSKEQRAQLKADGVADDVIDAMRFMQKDVFAPETGKIRMFENGKELVFNAPADIAKMVSGMDRAAVPLWAKIAGKPASWLRAGSTLNPDFLIKNLIRDQFTAGVQSNTGFKPFYNFATGMKGIFKDGEAFAQWQRNGGANSNLVSMDRDIKMLTKVDPQTVYEKIEHVANKPIDFLRMASELVENATRYGSYKHDISKGVPGPKAAYNAREISVDFQRQGASNMVRIFGQLVPFFNANLQGVDRYFRALKDNPVGVGMRTMGMVTIPSIALWFNNKDDPRYQELANWQKNLFWIFPTNDWKDIPTDAKARQYVDKLSDAWKRTLPDGTKQYNAGTLWHIPKPFGEGVIAGSVPERILEAYYQKKPNAFKDLPRVVTDALLPNAIPQVAVPAINAAQNYSSFLERPLMSAQQAKLPQAQQEHTYTSETAKTLAGAIRSVAGKEPVGGLGSPIIVDNYIREWTGGLGQYFVKALDAALKAPGKDTGAEPTKAWADVPGVKALATRFPDSNPQSVKDFYDMRADRTREKAGADALKKTDPTAYGERIKEGGLDPGKAYNDQLKAVNDAIKSIKTDKDMSSDAKRAAMDLAYLYRIEVAKKGLEYFEKTKRREKAPAQ